MLVLCLGFVIAFSDQLTKFFVDCHLRYHPPISVIPNVFRLTYVQNTGAAWGIMAGANSGLIILSITMLAVIIVWRRSLIGCAMIHRIAMGLMIGGIVGNLADRLRYGYVVDFLDFFWGTHHFPSFNVADSAICVGVGLYVVSVFFVKSVVATDATIGDTTPSAG